MPDLPPALRGNPLVLEPAGVGRIHGYRSDAKEGRPLLLVHSVNAVASAFEVRPVYDHYASQRPTYALDLPGFGLSDRSDRDYTARLMTDAVLAMVKEIRSRHGEDQPIDVLGLSLSCEFAARAAAEAPGAVRTLALVSPTGMNGTTRRDGPEGSTREVPGLHSVLAFPLWGSGLFKGLTRPSVIRYFLEKTWGGKNIDEELWAYDVLLAKHPGAHHAPLCFLSGQLFSNDVSRLYERLEMPVWMSHGVRGDFVDYRGADRMRSRANWRITSFETGAIPYFEVPGPFFEAYDAFLASAG